MVLVESIIHDENSADIQDHGGNVNGSAQGYNDDTDVDQGGHGAVNAKLNAAADDQHYAAMEYQELVQPVNIHCEDALTSCI